jgi:hypothetical protein
VHKRKRGISVLEALYPHAPEELVLTAKEWVADSSNIMLSALWHAYDALIANPNLKSALSVATDDLERGLTRLIYFATEDLLTGDEPFRLLPEAPEDESRKKPPARPRTYDIAFAMRINPRIMWSVEAKVLASPTSLSDYVGTLKQRYLSGDYAPFVAEGAMAGYLLQGKANDAFKAIAGQLRVRLAYPNQWKGRDHRVSTHCRRIPQGKPYPKRFRCHHLIMEFV